MNNSNKLSKIKNQIYIGAKLTASGEGDLTITFPAFMFDGETNTEITSSTNALTVSYDGYSCTYATTGTISDRNTIVANCNGHYALYSTYGKDSITLEVKM